MRRDESVIEGDSETIGNTILLEGTMAKLILKFDDRVLKECIVGMQPVVIGRIPNNTMVIDNPAVSSHHARVFHDGKAFVVEDLHSTNGTFVNEQLVSSVRLRDGDVMLIGKHELVFSDADAESKLAADIPGFGGTMMLDTRQQRELLAKSRVGLRPAPRTVARVSEAATSRVGVLKVLSGRVDQPEYMLSGPTSLVGKSETALVQLKGWFKPRLALAIARKGDHYAVMPLGGKTWINGRRIDARYDLKDGDVLEVGGVKLEFRSQQPQ